MFRKYSSEKPKKNSSSTKKRQTPKPGVERSRRGATPSDVEANVFEKVIEMERRASQESRHDRALNRTDSIVSNLDSKIPRNQKDFPDPKCVGQNISEEFFCLESQLYQGFMTGTLSKGQISLQYTRNTRALREYLEDLWIQNQEASSKADEGMTEEEVNEAFNAWTKTVNKEIQKGSDQMITKLYGSDQKKTKKKTKATPKAN